MVATARRYQTHAEFRDFAWFGEPDRESWPIMLSQTRDSDALARSNWRVIVADVREKHPDTEGADWQITDCGHWLCGWVQSVIARPDSAVFATLDAWHEQLTEVYPVADDDDYSDLEYEEANRCQRCKAVLYHPSGEYDDSRDYCDRCVYINRVADATYRPVVSRHHRAPRYHRPLTRHDRAVLAWQRIPA